MTKKYRIHQALAVLSLSLIGSDAVAENIDQMSPSELYKLGEKYEAIGSKDKSFLYFDKSAQDNYVPAMLKLSTIYKQDGKSQKSNEYLNKAVKAGDATALYIKSEQYCGLKSSRAHQECIRLLSLSASKGNAGAYRKLAEYRQSSKQSYQDYLKAFAIDKRFYNLFRHAKNAGHNDDKIINDIEKILKQKGDKDSDIARTLGTIFNSEGYSNFSDLATDLKRLDIANKYFKKAIDLDPKNKALNGYVAQFEANGYGGQQNWEKAFHHLKLAAEANPGRFNDTLAFMYYYGLGTEQNIQKAIDLKEESDFPYFFAKIYAKGSGVKQNLENYVNYQLEASATETIEHYTQSFYQMQNQLKFEATAELKNSNTPDATFSQAVLLLQKKDYSQALEKFLPLAQDGNKKAIDIVASMHARGLGCTKNYQTSFEWYEKIADEDKALNNLIGLNYLYGLNGYIKNRSKAKEIIGGRSFRYIDLADKIPITNKLKILLLNQEEILRKGKRIKEKELSLDQSQEAYYYLLAASEKSGEACNLLGEVLLEQWEIQRAKDFFLKAIKLGHQKANQNLGFMYLNGYGTLPDLHKALEYYSTERPKPEAYYQMSRNFAVNSDYTTAFKICLLEKAIQEDPSFAGAWMDLLRMDPRRGDQKYHLKRLERACEAAKVDKSIFCTDYKNVRNGRTSMFLSPY